MRDLTGNLAPMPGIFPDYLAPIICTGDDGVRELVMARWGMLSPAQVTFEATKARADRMRARGDGVNFEQLLKMEPDKGVTNVRNLASPHWAPAHWCLVPFTSFSEFIREAGGDIWFARGKDRPLSFFAGIWRRDWTGVRKLKTGVETIDLFTFLTCEPNAELRAVYPKAMPAILTEDRDFEQWMLSPWREAKTLQRPLPDGKLQVVGRGGKLDDA